MDRRLSLVLPALLSGCGIVSGGAAHDDPRNVPLAGQWQRSIRLVALTINDVSIDRDHAPFAIPADTSQTICGEPTLRTREDAEREINALGVATCTLDTPDRQGTTVTGGGTCTLPSNDANKVAGKMSYAIEEAAEAIDGKHIFDVYVHLPSGETEQARVVHKTEWRRLGDCR